MRGRSHPGRLTERVTFQEATLVDDSVGGFSTSWGSIDTTPTMWASVEPLTGREALHAGQLEARVTHRVTVRRRSDLTAQMRIRWDSNGNKILNIRAIEDPGPRAPYLWIQAELGVAT